MKAEPILQELEAVKERLAAQADGDTQRFLEQMDAWFAEHPHAGPVVNSVAELQARIQAREATEPAPLPGEPYKVYDPVIAEVHRIRELFHMSKLLSDQPIPESSGRSAMSIVMVRGESQAPSGAACMTQTAAPDDMPLLTELGSSAGVRDYRHAAPDGAFAPVPGVNLRVER
jgi:hypothetical protein